MKFNPWHSLWGALIIMIGNSIGANDVLKYETGSETLSSRSEYCEYIRKSQTNRSSSHLQIETLPEMEFFESQKQRNDFLKVWNLQKTFSAYHNKRISFYNLPQELNRNLEELSMNLKFESNQMKQQLQALSLKSQRLPSSQPSPFFSSTYQNWQIKNEWPLHAKILQDKIRQLQAKISRLDSRQFSGREFLKHIANTKKPINQKLVIEIVVEEGLFHSDVLFYPRWKDGSGNITAASDSPYLRVKSSFVPTLSLVSLKNKTQPPTLIFYSQLFQPIFEPKALSRLKIEYLESGKAIVAGSLQTGFLASHSDSPATSPTDLALSGLLDLACLSSKKMRHSKYL